MIRIFYLRANTGNRGKWSQLSYNQLNSELNDQFYRTLTTEKLKFIFRLAWVDCLRSRMCLIPFWTLYFQHVVVHADSHQTNQMKFEFEHLRALYRPESLKAYGVDRQWGNSFIALASIVDFLRC